MAKRKESSFECSHCGNQSPKWLGRCPGCGEWNSYVELSTRNPQLIKGEGANSGRIGRQTKSNPVRPAALATLEVSAEARLDMGTQEFNRVLGGGMLQGSSVLLGGEPGIGKSTLLLQAAAVLARRMEVLYISGEESPSQIRLRATRLGLGGQGIHLLASSRPEDIEEAIIEIQPGMVIMDSVQTLWDPLATGVPGSPAQIRYGVHMLGEYARSVGAGLLLVAHVTKDGSIAGPKVLEHMVDVVLYFEEGEDGLRMLRAWKNRYGSTDEIGLFTMAAEGLVEIGDSQGLLGELRKGAPPPGVVLTPLFEGSRILPVEIQALTVPNKAGISRVYSDRIDQRRVSRIAAVLEKHGGLGFSDQEIYVNVAGGLRIQDVGVDLALAAALFSARSGLSLPEACALCGEVSLSGEIRRIRHLDKRIQACRDFGLGRICIPDQGEAPAENLVRIRNVAELVRQVFGRSSRSSGRQDGKDRDGIPQDATEA